MYGKWIASPALGAEQRATATATGPWIDIDRVIAGEQGTIQWMAPRVVGVGVASEKGTGRDRRRARARWTNGSGTDRKCWYVLKRRPTDKPTPTRNLIAHLRRNHGTGEAATLAPENISLLPPRPRGGGVARDSACACRARPAPGRRYSTSLALVGPLCSVGEDAPCT